MSVRTWRGERQTYGKMLGIKLRNSGAMMGYIGAHSGGWRTEERFARQIEDGVIEVTGSGGTPS